MKIKINDYNAERINEGLKSLKMEKGQLIAKVYNDEIIIARRKKATYNSCNVTKMQIISEKTIETKQRWTSDAIAYFAKIAKDALIIIEEETKKTPKKEFELIIKTD